MSLKDEVSQGSGIWHRARVDEALGKKEAAELAEVLADPSVKPYRIWTRLRARGIDISSRPIYEWAERARRVLG